MTLMAACLKAPLRGAIASSRLVPSALRLFAETTTASGAVPKVRRTFASTTPDGQEQEQEKEMSERPMDMAYAPVNDFLMNQYVVACTKTKQAAIIDCGAASAKQLGVFLHWMQEKDYQLTAVWQTHGHLDHVAGLGILRAQHSEDIPIHLHVSEREIYNSFDERRKEFGLQVEGDGILPPDSELTFFDDTQTSMSLGELTFYVFPTPGHSPGHVGFFEPLSKSFFGGDFIMQGSIGRTDFPTSSPKDMNKSLERFVQVMDDDVVIFPGHGPATELKHEKQVNPFLQAYANNWGGA